jgi:alpha-beta hydrolase superfamily lysophospholipase
VVILHGGVEAWDVTRVFRFLVRLLLRIAVVAVVIVLTVMLVRAFDARRQPDLQAWHTTRFAHEFTAADVGPGTRYSDFLAAEDAAFAELDEKVVSEGRRLAFPLLRYNPASRSWPETLGRNWNRSFELKPESPWGGIVLVHGLTDSPYSMRTIGEIFRDHGLQVVAPRMPGHGLAPSGLLDATWQDWLAVVGLAVAHLRETLGPEAPVLVGGYSNGGSLVVKYTLDALEDDALVLPDQVYLFSPAIGITAFATVAGWHRLLAAIPYFEKFRWEGIEPEFDPYKYNSFPKIAGHQTFTLSVAVNRQLERLQVAGQLDRMPPILAFQSLADATVLTESLVSRLFDRLTLPNSELVLFDNNRYTTIREFLQPRYDRLLEGIIASPRRGYSLTLLTNADDRSMDVVARTLLAGGGEVEGQPTGLSWPLGIYSMSHVAVPFAEDDPVYGRRREPGDFTLGDIALRGERNTLSLAVESFLRLRYNPFYPYMSQRIVEFLAPLEQATASR